jgi:cytochrome c2
MKLKAVLPGLALAFAMNSFAIPPNESGKTIFMTRCASCHNVNKLLVGPALAGIDQRRSLDWIVRFVQSSQALVKSGDKDATALFEKFHVVMPDHGDLKPEDIKDIVEFIKSEAVAPGTEEKAPFARPDKLRPAYVPLSLNNYGFFASYLLAVIILIGVLLFFVRVKEYGRNKTSD